MSYRLTREERLYLQFMFAVMNRLIEVCPSYLAGMTNTVTGCVLEVWRMKDGAQSLAQLADIHARAAGAYRLFVCGPQAALLQTIHERERARWRDDEARTFSEGVFAFHAMSLALLLKGTIGRADVRRLYDAFLRAPEKRAAFLRACTDTCAALGVTPSEMADVLHRLTVTPAEFHRSAMQHGATATFARCGGAVASARQNDDHKIAIISCVNDEAMYADARARLEQLALPAGFALDFVPVRGAPSMCAGYNAGMAMTDARYKLYLHQDMMAERMDLLPLLVSFFNAHPDVGLVGLAGSFDWEPHAIWWDAQQCYYNLDVWAHANGAQQSHGLVTGRMDAPWAPAAMLDGIFLMTQVDVPWREDVFRGWHFYDISACAEMRRAGHGIAILRQDTPWFAHCSGNIKVNMAYHYWRAVFLQTYKEELAAWQQAT